MSAPCPQGRTDYEACFAPFRYCPVKGCGRTEASAPTDQPGADTDDAWSDITARIAVALSKEPDEGLRSHWALLGARIARDRLTPAAPPAVQGGGGADDSERVLAEIRLRDFIDARGPEGGERDRLRAALRLLTASPAGPGGELDRERVIRALMQTTPDGVVLSEGEYEDWAAALAPLLTGGGRDG